MAILRGSPDNAPYGIYNHIQSWKGNISDLESFNATFDPPVKEVVVTVLGDTVLFNLAEDGVTWGYSAYILGDSTMVIPYNALAWAIAIDGGSGEIDFYVQGFGHE